MTPYPLSLLPRPQVGKALLSLAKLYMAEGSARSRQLATAALSRAQDIMTVCQVRAAGIFVCLQEPTCPQALPAGRRSCSCCVAPLRAVGLPFLHGLLPSAYCRRGGLVP